ncbi:alpha-glucosidase [Wenyingzhuangia heitensis]|uniref:Alpha-glucosidase n=1 Tax=Wenyingzhuangia heitensis TaxID=1487859 RepID=A0ABX0UC06_9FLAO|nr:TIM-barrel domain-containing protein [Wenyingzhuangia heitensis]NIJ46362.1 alpha-glucosidase [Wenyingzhuangia heitensis]
MSQFDFIQVNEFQPNLEGWNQIGAIKEYLFSNNNKDLLLINENGYQVKISFLSETAIRVRFKPVVNPDYSGNESYAVVNRNLGNVSVNYIELPDNGGTLHITTGQLDIFVGLAPYGISVQKDGKVITEDTYSKNIVFSNEAVANLKKAPTTESYFGFGEKAGEILDKKENTMTFFNYDNFSYLDGGVVPDDNTGGPLNPSSPLYNSMPYCLAIGKGENAIKYAYGVYLDNVSQTYFNMGANDYSDMDGKYYFGALYGELDYYIMIGSTKDGSQNEASSVISQYSKLTGASAMPPMYALGYQQGCYGYFDREKLEGIAKAYRDANIPIDGLHIDVDFQDNYRTFTNSEVKFPNVGDMFENLHNEGFKCSTNITGIITANPYDETGKQPGDEGYKGYPTRDNLVDLNVNSAMESNYLPNTVPPLTDSSEGDISPYPQAFIWNTRYDEGKNPKIFMAQESYGSDTYYQGKPYNPYVKNYPSPGHPQGQNNLGTYGYYMDLGIESVKEYWGAQYKYLLSKGLDMIWQDMTCPALVANSDNDTAVKSLPLDLEMYDKVTNQYQPNAKIHNSFSLNLVTATYEGLTKLKKDEATVGSYNYKKRNFIISRGGFAGVHRYAGIWTGDSASSWDFLKINIPEVLNIGLSGLPISGCDIGGFAGGSGSVSENGTHKVTQYELFTRWMTAGAFLPWYRNHYDGYNKSFQEPFYYGEPVPTNCRKYINMRYQLLQVFYDYMFESTQNGLPICRALFINEPNDINVFNYADQQFFLGKDVLVAPVTDENWNKDVYLPNKNNWFVFDVNGAALPQPTQGGKAYSWYVPLDLVPVYIREGAILPIRELTQFVDAEKANYLNFFIYPTSKEVNNVTTYQLYQDDKVSTNFEEEEAYRITEVKATKTQTGRNLTFNRAHNNYTPLESYFFVSFLGVQSNQAVITINGKQLKESTKEKVEKATKNAFYYDEENQKIVTKIIDNVSTITIDIDYTFEFNMESVLLNNAELV